MTQYSNPANEVTDYPMDLNGFHPTARSTSPAFRIGTVGQGKQGTKWVYTMASEAVTGTCTLSTSTFLLTDTAGNYTVPAAFAANEFGWVRQTAKDLA